MRFFFLNQIEQAVTNGQDLRKKHEFRDQSWLGLKTRSRDPTLSRHKGININELYLHTKIAQTATGRYIDNIICIICRIQEIFQHH